MSYYSWLVFHSLTMEYKFDYLRQGVYYGMLTFVLDGVPIYKRRYILFNSGMAWKDVFPYRLEPVSCFSLTDVRGLIRPVLVCLTYLPHV